MLQPSIPVNVSLCGGKAARDVWMKRPTSESLRISCQVYRVGSDLWSWQYLLGAVGSVRGHRIKSN